VRLRFANPVLFALACLPELARRPANCRSIPLAEKSVPDQSRVSRRKLPNISVRQRLPYEPLLDFSITLPAKESYDPGDLVQLDTPDIQPLPGLAKAGDCHQGTELGQAIDNRLIDGRMML
jgi:hypothetical protein